MYTLELLNYTKWVDQNSRGRQNQQTLLIPKTGLNNLHYQNQNISQLKSILKKNFTDDNSSIVKNRDTSNPKGKQKLFLNKANNIEQKSEDHNL